MRDDELRRLFKTLERPYEPDPAFADQLFSQLSAPAQTRRRGSGRPMLLLAAALLVVALAAGAVVGSQLLQRDITSEATPLPLPSASGQELVPSGSVAPSASATPAPSEPASELAYSPPEGVLPAGALATVNADLAVHEQPDPASTLRFTAGPGSTLRIGGAPLVVGDALWYSVTEEGDEVDPASARGGYAAIDPRADDVTLEPVVCPGDAGLASVTALGPWERLACFGDRELTLEGNEIVGFGGMAPGLYEPAWLAYPIGFRLVISADGGETNLPIRAPEDFDVSRPPAESELGPLLRVTGHFNDAASESCTISDIPVGSGEQTLDAEPLHAQVYCREQFVLTSFEVLDTTPPPVAVDQVVETTVIDLTLREEPGTGSAALGVVDLGSRWYVIGGPVEADGLPWFHVAGMGLVYRTGCIAEPPGRVTCPAASGWMAGENAAGDPWLRSVDVSDACPSETTLQTLAALQWTYRLVCFENQDVTLRGYYPEIPQDAGLGGACQQEPEEWGWLFCQNVNYNGLSLSEGPTFPGDMLFTVEPDRGVTLPERGQWIEVTGQFDHAMSRACGDGAPSVTEAQERVFFCRWQFAVSAVRVVEGP